MGLNWLRRGFVSMVIYIRKGIYVHVKSHYMILYIQLYWWLVDVQTKFRKRLTRSLAQRNERLTRSLAKRNEQYKVHIDIIYVTSSCWNCTLQIRCIEGLHTTMYDNKLHVHWKKKTRAFSSYCHELLSPGRGELLGGQDTNGSICVCPPPLQNSGVQASSAYL